MTARLMTVKESMEFFSSIPQQELLLLHGQHLLTVQSIYPTKKKTRKRMKKTK